MTWFVFTGLWFLYSNIIKNKVGIRQENVVCDRDHFQQGMEGLEANKLILPKAATAGASSRSALQLFP